VEVLAMSSDVGVAIVSIAIASGFSLVGLVVQGLLAAYHFGRHAQRLAAVEERTTDVATNNAALAVLTATVGAIDNRLSEVAADVKNLLIGRIGGNGARQKSQQ
jgi:hypothetical protein